MRTTRTLQSRVVILAVGLLATLGAPAAPWGVPFAQAAPDYAAVEPLLRKYCVGCHGPQEANAELRLDTYAGLQAGGENGPLLDAEQPQASRLLQVLTGKAEPRMPPEDVAQPSREELAQIVAWIEAGAKGPAAGERPAMLVVPELPAAPVRPAVTAVDYAAGPGLLAMARFGEVELVDDATGEIRHRWTGLTGKVNDLDFSDDGKWLVAASGVAGLRGELRLWDVEQGQPGPVFSGHDDLAFTADFSPDGRWIASGSYDQTIVLWEVKSGTPVRTLRGHNGAVYDVAFSPDGKVLASASGDETVKIWRLETGERLDTLGQPLAEQYCVTFSPDGQRVVAGGADNRVRVWRLVTREQPGTNPLEYARFAHEGPLVQLAFTSDGSRLVSTAEDRTIKVWRTSDFTELELYPTQPDIPSAVAVVDDRQLAVGRLDGALSRLPLPALPENVPGPADSGPSTSVPSQSAGELLAQQEQEPNNGPEQAQSVQLPARLSGVVHAAGEQPWDEDVFRFEAKAGEAWILETHAAVNGSPVDTRLEILDSEGRAVPRVILQAVRDSYITFRGIDSSTIDVRLHNWEEMDLNQYVYMNGEVARLFLYPRGPDSGFQLFNISNRRRTYFDTTAMTHALHEPAYIVEPLPVGTSSVPNGLPTFPIFFENDDASEKFSKGDSRLTFVAPAAGAYLVRVSDVRQQQGEDYRYELVVRRPEPSFQVRVGFPQPVVNAGSGKEFEVFADRIDNYEGPIEIEIQGLPPGWYASSPLTIEAEQYVAGGTINVVPGTPELTDQQRQAIRLVARATIDGREVRRELQPFDKLQVGPAARLLVALTPAGDEQPPVFLRPADPTATDDVPEPNKPEPNKPVPAQPDPASSEAAAKLPQPPPVRELVIRPGETITADLHVDRGGFTDRIAFESLQLNLPHGVIVDNIGLNGVLIPEGQDRRTVYFTAAAWTPESSRLIYFKANADGTQTSWPVWLHVRRD